MSTQLVRQRTITRPTTTPKPWRVVGSATALALVLAVGYLLAPRLGTDLSAQVAHATFFRVHGITPVDLRWYGGSEQFGYSLLSPAMMALVGVRACGAASLVVASAAFALLLWRTRVPRPLLGALVGVLCIAGNLVSGRITYALAVAFGLLALLALTLPSQPARLSRLTRDDQPDPLSQPVWPARSDRRVHRVRTAGVVTGGLLASATSPVAGLFLGLVAVALLASRRYRDGLLLGLAATLPLLVTGLLFGEGGWMNTGRTDTVHAVFASLAVAALVPRRPVRVGALLSAAGILAAALVHTPVGLNATRLAVMFTLPVLAAAAQFPAALGARMPGTAVGGAARAASLVALLAVGYWWQPPLLVNDLRDWGHPTSKPGYFTPLLDQLRQRGVTGRVEIPPTRDYWESAYLNGFPLARGWLRQVDIERNPLFFTTIPGNGGTGVPLTADSYRAWLDENAVQWVALPDATLSWVGRPEAALVDAELPYLTPVWSGQHWRLYAVDAPVPVVAAPATLVSQNAAQVTFAAPAAGEVTVRVRWTRWTTVSGGATVSRDGDWVRVGVPHAGRYTIGSSLGR